MTGIDPGRILDLEKCRLVNGIYRSTDAATTAHDAFLEFYRALRRREGRGSDRDEDYRALPGGPMAARHRSEWKYRASSLAWLTELLSDRPGSVILDIGAGNCWMSYRLSTLGHLPVAVDINDDAYDGLGAGSRYRVGKSVPFLRLLADMRDLPVRAGSVDVVLFNASLHYSRDTDDTVASAIRAVRPGGLLVVLDSPVYVDRRSGDEMVRRRGGHQRAQFLIESDLERWDRFPEVEAVQDHRSTSFGARIRRYVRTILLRREPARLSRFVVRIES